MANVPILNVMPVYNCPRVVGLGIRCVLEQTFQDWRLVIVDDSSDEGCTRLAVTAAVHDDPRVTVIRSDRYLPIPRKRDLGVAACDSTWIAQWDCDNYYPPNRLQVQLDSIADDAMAVSHIAFTRWANIYGDDYAWQLKANGHPLQLNCGGTFFLSRALWEKVNGHATDQHPGEDLHIAGKIASVGGTGVPAPSAFSEGFLGMEWGGNVWSGRASERFSLRTDVLWRKMLPEWAEELLERARR